VFAALFPLGLSVSLAVWILAVAVTRYVSVGSMLGGLALFASACLLRESPFGESKFLTAFTALTAVLSIIRHRSNIGRLLKGAEPKIGARRKT
jgi:glycerol-3-phosphate acyltransferase PlsY